MGEEATTLVYLPPPIMMGVRPLSTPPVWNVRIIVSRREVPGPGVTLDPSFERICATPGLGAGSSTFVRYAAEPYQSRVEVHCVRWGSGRVSTTGVCPRRRDPLVGGRPL